MDTKTVVALIVLTAAAPLHLAAQSLAGRHLLELRVGAWNQLTESRTEVGASGVSTSVDASGFIGGITYGQWLREDLSWRIGIGAMAASVDSDVGASGVTTEVAIVSPLLVGLRYYLSGSAPSSSARPFVGGSIGAFIGSQANTTTGTIVAVEERTESAVGFEGSAGVDILMGSHFLLSVVLAYDGMTDFDRPIGGSVNYSGPQFRLGFGWVFGGGSV